MTQPLTDDFNIDWNISMVFGFGWWCIRQKLGPRSYLPYQLSASFS